MFYTAICGKIGVPLNILSSVCHLIDAVGVPKTSKVQSESILNSEIYYTLRMVF